MPVRNQPFCERRRWGFTALELVLVIAVIALLAGIAFTVVGPVRSTVRRSVCQGNLERLGAAFALYVSDHGHYPWSPVIFTAMGTKDPSTLYCPEDTRYRLLGVVSSYAARAWLPPDGRLLARQRAVDPRIVLLSCRHPQNYERAEVRGGRVVVRSSPGAYQLVLRANGTVDRVPAEQVRKMPSPFSPEGRLDVYPGEPGYDQFPP